MTHLLTKTLAVLIVFLSGNLLRAQETATQKNMLWKAVNAQGQTAYLLGSVHMVNSDFYPLKSIYDEAFEKTDALALEVNIDSLMMQSQFFFVEKGFYAAEDRLENHLPDSTYQKLDARLTELQFPLGHVNRMKPWLITMTLQALEVQKAGFNQPGLDQYFFNKAKEAEKPVYSLETAEFQQNIFAGMDDEKQVEYLDYMLSNSKENADDLGRLIDFWKSGDSEAMGNLMEKELKDYSEDMYNKLLVDRNKNWIPRIQNILKEGKTPLIVVGAGHLAGSDSVIYLLKQEGFRVEQL